MLDSPTLIHLVDQNKVCGSSTAQRDYFPRIHLCRCIPLFRDTSDMYPYFPFDPPTQSDTYLCRENFEAQTFQGLVPFGNKFSKMAI